MRSSNDRDAAMSSDGNRAVQLSTLRQLDTVEGPGAQAEPFSVRLAKLYLTTSVELIDKLQAAQDAGDADAAGFAAHTLKSGTAMVGALGLAASLASVEAAARGGSLDCAGPLFETIEREYVRVRGELMEYVRAGGFSG